MIIVHDLDDSRSQRILWLLEELGVPYELRQHKRDTKSRLAPVELKRVHPLGKSPVIEDDDYVVAESGAIIDYILRKFENGRLQPPGQLLDRLGSEPDSVKETFKAAGIITLVRRMRMSKGEQTSRGQPQPAKNHNGPQRPQETL